MHSQPFTIDIADAAIDDLRQRLARTRLVPGIAGLGWTEGTDGDFLQRLLSYWRDTFDWPAAQARLNQLPQFRAEVAGQTLHFIHQRGTGPAPLPLIISHGWPGSVVEMQAIIPLLTDPGAHGGDPRDAFDVVVPSLPGYGFSPAPRQTGTGPRQVAALWAELMSGLGYPRFAAQGGDWGAAISTWLAREHAERLVGVHLNFLPGSYRPPLGPDQPPVSLEEQAYLDRYADWSQRLGAYGHIQGTKPQTLAVGLNDSPAGLAAWITEKFQAWTDCAGDLESAVSLDELLTNISLYWFTGSIGSSFRMYLESRARPLHFAPGERIQTPVGVAVFPAELPMPPRSWVERVYNVRQWSEFAEGGHFAALEQPRALAEDIRAFFRPLRQPLSR